MAKDESETTEDGLLTEAELATYGIPPKQDEETAIENSDPNEKEGENKMMKPSTQDRAEGTLHEVKGKIKEEVGKATNKPDLEDAGAVEKNAGKIQKLIGKVEKAVGE